MTLNCGHTFCQHCIGKWRKISNTCPSCRKGIKSENRVYLLDEILEKVESEMDREEDREKIKRREEQKREHNAQFMENRRRQVGNAIPEPVWPRDLIHREVIEFELVSGILSQVCIQFDHTPAVINPGDTLFEFFRNVYNTNEEYERQALL